jgi:EpsI family protein
MRNLKSRAIAVIVLLGLAAFTSAMMLYPHRMDRGTLKATQLPIELQDWVGREMPVEDYVKRILETDDVIQRNYVSPKYGNAQVQMAVVFSADNRRVAHPPEVCYRGAGWEVVDKRVIAREGLPPMVRVLFSAGSGHKDLVYYCYKAGNQMTANYYRQQLNIAAGQLCGRSTASALIRFSTSVGTSDADAEVYLQAFMRLMMHQIEQKLTP